MRNVQIITFFSPQAYDLLQRIYKIDRLWRHISKPALSEFLPLHNSRNMYKVWLNIIDEMQNFIDVLWRQFESLQSGNVDYAKHQLNPEEMVNIVESAKVVQNARGRSFRAIISSYICSEFIIQCKAIDMCFTILLILPKSSDKLNEGIVFVKNAYQIIIEKIDQQYKLDGEMLEKAFNKMSTSQNTILETQ